MADAAAAPAPTPAKKTSVKKATKPKKPAAHPKYSEMIVTAITSLKDRTGSSGQAIKKYITANFKVDEKSVGPHVRAALKKGVTSGALKQVKGTGASGSFKVAEKTKVVKTKAAKKPATKKPAAAKKPAAPKSPKKAAKKTVTKKPAAVKKTPKKSTKKVAKSPAAKKPKAKKATKKPAAKKVAAKK